MRFANVLKMKHLVSSEPLYQRNVLENCVKSLVTDHGAAKEEAANKMDLQEFLTENGVEAEAEAEDGSCHSRPKEDPMSMEFSPLDLALATRPGSDYHFDPSNARFSEDELRPQPITKKSRKQHVPDGLKDSRYWARRVKNNMAAKRSREARRLKENQIVLRASYLEKENEALKVAVERLREENEKLRQMMSPT